MKKVYNEKETAAILKKAAQNSHVEAPGESPGLTVDELQEIARDSGIDPDQIDKAVQEIDGEQTRPDHTFWGGPFSFDQQLEIDHEITSLEWEKMLLDIRAFFQDNGKVSERSSVYEWTSPRGSTNSAQVVALKDNGKTQVRVGWKGPLSALPFYIPVPLVAIASLPFASEFLQLSSVPGMAFVAISVMATFSAGRWALRRHLAKGFEKLRQFTNSLQQGSLSEPVAKLESDLESAPVMDSFPENEDEQLIDVDWSEEKDESEIKTILGRERE